MHLRAAQNYFFEKICLKMCSQEHINFHEKLSVKHFNKLRLLSFTSAMLKCFGDRERHWFSLL